MAAGSPHTVVGEGRPGSRDCETKILERGCSNILCLKETNSSWIMIISRLHRSRGAGVRSQRMKQALAMKEPLWRLKTELSVDCGWSPQALHREDFVLQSCRPFWSKAESWLVSRGFSKVPAPECGRLQAPPWGQPAPSLGAMLLCSSGCRSHLKVWGGHEAPALLQCRRGCGWVSPVLFVSVVFFTWGLTAPT